MSLSVKNQSIETSGITKDYKEAICEYIWNGFEANATEVRVSYTCSELQGIDTISITDNGDGINYDNLSETFGAFLASQKSSLSLKLKTKVNKGKGRFSFSAFSSIAKWTTKYDDNGVIKSYSITLTNENKETYEYDEPQEVKDDTVSGTTVVFYNIYGILPEDLDIDSLEDFLLYEFSWYLYLNRDKGYKIYLNDTELDYSKHINTKYSDTTIETIDNNQFEISVIVWNEKISEKFRVYYFDSNNAIKGIDTTTYNRNTVDFNHSVFIHSRFFDTWQEERTFDIPDQTSLFTYEESQRTLKTLKKIVQAFLAQKMGLYMSGKADEEIKKMIEVRKTFPSFSDDDYGNLRKRDLMRVTREIYSLEPRIFYKLKEIQEKSLLAFLNLLLSSEERESVLTVIDEIVQLTTDQRKKFSDILKKTHLENIIDTIAFIENRYRIIETLKEIVYDLGKFANERDHIQKIVEQNYWIFGEQYHLASADKTMQRALEQYIHILYGANEEIDALPPNVENQRRMDIFLCGARNVETSFGSYIEENMVIELKAPNVSLNKTVLRQVEDYMDYIRSKQQFNSLQRRWKFIAVCKSVEDSVKGLYKTFESFGKPGLVYQSEKYEIYAFTWDDVFTGFNLRHSFMLDKLKYNRNIIMDELKSANDKRGREAVNELTEMAIAE